MNGHSVNNHPCNEATNDAIMWPFGSGADRIKGRMHGGRKPEKGAAPERDRHHPLDAAESGRYVPLLKYEERQDKRSSTSDEHRGQG